MAKGITRRANTLDEESIQRALEFIDERSEVPLRDRLLLLMTCRLGLRAQEAAMVHAEDILDAKGALRTDFFVSARGAKYGKSRYLAMHPAVKAALVDYLESYRYLRTGPLFFNQYGEPLTSTAVQKQLARIYQGIGLRGCSSHSGRRTFGTRMAQNVMKIGGSIKNVTELMGHSSVTTTENYVEVTPVQRQLVMMQ